MSEQMPELGTPTYGQEILIDTRTGGRTTRLVRARIVKVSPVWLDVEPLEGEFLGQNDRRFRRDNQRTKAKPENWTSIFYTLEQHAWQERRREAANFLRELGIYTTYGSPYERKTIELANILKRGLGQPEL